MTDGLMTVLCHTPIGDSLDTTYHMGLETALQFSEIENCCTPSLQTTSTLSVLQRVNNNCRSWSCNAVVRTTTVAFGVQMMHDAILHSLSKCDDEILHMGSGQRGGIPYFRMFT